MNQLQKGQIRNLLILFTSGIVAALLVAALLLKYYGPSGRYSLKGTLLAPELLESLSFHDHKAHFVFGGIEYAYYDLEKKQWKHVPVSLERYADFYHVIKKQESLPQMHEDVFGNPSKLILHTHIESGDSKKTFQEVQFSPDGNYFRVQLRDNSPGNRWVYFYRPGILSLAQSTFIK